MQKKKYTTTIRELKRGLKNFSSLDQGYAEDEKLENLIDAIRSEDIPAIKEAIADCKGLDINYFYAWSGNYESVIGEAVSTGNIEIVKLILDAGGDINHHCGTYAEESTAGIAAAQGNLELLKFLLDNGAKASGDTDGDPCYRPITQSICMGNDPAIVELLLDYDSSSRVLDKEDGEGFTPLAMAAYAGNLACAKLLVEAGADVNKRCSEGTPLQIAEEKGHTKVANYLRSVMGESRKGKNFSRRRGARNFASTTWETTNKDGDTYEEKVRTINKIWFGDNTSDYLSGRKIVELLDQTCKIDTVADPSTIVHKAVFQLFDVLMYYLAAEDRPASLAVYEPAKIVASNLDISEFQEKRNIKAELDAVVKSLPESIACHYNGHNVEGDGGSLLLSIKPGVDEKVVKKDEPEISQALIEHRFFPFRTFNRCSLYTDARWVGFEIEAL